MNVYFKYLSSKIPFFHEFAKKLDKYESIDRFGATVESGGKYGIFDRPNDKFRFLDTQQDIEYDQLHFQRDIHEKLLTSELPPGRLAELEAEFGDPWLIDFLVSARDTYYRQYNHEEKQRLIGNLLEFYTDLFEEFQPDVFITEDLGSFTSLIPFHLVENRYDGTSVWAQTTRVRDRYSVLRNPYDQHENIHERFGQFKENGSVSSEYCGSKQKAQEFVGTFRSDQSVEKSLDVVRGLHTARQFGIGDTIRTVYKYLDRTARHAWLYNVERYGKDYKMDPTYKHVLAELRGVYRRTKHRFGDRFEAPRDDEPFVYFPLHFQPEWSTLVLAPQFTHQPGLVDQISKSIPLTHKLYVKDHPKMAQRGYRESSYYDALDRIENVRLIDPRVDSHELIRESDVVTTITGTAGLEALLYETPVITFGQVNYNVMDAVHTCSSIQRLPEQLHEAIHSYQHDEQELLLFLAAVFAESFKFNSESTVVGPDHPDYEHTLQNLVREIRAEAFEIEEAA